MENESCPLVLTPGVQHYEWGGTTVIPALLEQTNPDKRPFAELWMGAHPGNPSRVASRFRAVRGVGRMDRHEPRRKFWGLRRPADSAVFPFSLKF
jgi:hypothetical protein